jgi:acetyl esterase/lipase
VRLSVQSSSLLLCFFVSGLGAVSPKASPKGQTALERLEETHLQAVHETRIKWMKDRVVLPPLGIYHDYRAVMHVHAEDAEHTLGTREQVLEAAREAGVQIVMWSDHRGPNPESWHGFRHGVLFISGSEDDDNKLRYPEPGNDLLFLSHIEEAPDKSSEGFQGMEIYNRHTDAKVNPELTAYLQKALKDAKEFSRLEAKEKKYPDEVFAAGTGYLANYMARFDKETADHPFTGIAANDAHRNVVLNKVVFDPYEVSFRNVSTHILARELKDNEIRESLRDGHVYVAHDWLCDPSGFTFFAVNNFGLFDIGDRVPMLPNTRLLARFPIPAHAKLFRNGTLVYETTGKDLTFKPTEEGAYRLEAWLPIDGEERPWIYSNPLYFAKPPADILKLPPTTTTDAVKVEHDIVYADGKPEDANKHKLDLYLPAGKSNFPVLFFVHGGSWRSGDRSQYPGFGNRFAKDGVGVVIPSYRLAPQNAPPAQIEDVAAAFAWTVKHIADYGGDAKRIFIAGHSAGGHLVAELALDSRWLGKYDLNPSLIRGVAALSGIYDVTSIATFGNDPQSRKQYSPIEYVNKKAPPFLVTYCEHDYPGLAVQARAFDADLRKTFVASTLVYVPKENHISEIVNTWKEDDPTARAMLGLIFGK